MDGGQSKRASCSGSNLAALVTILLAPSSASSTTTTPLPLSTSSARSSVLLQRLLLTRQRPSSSHATASSTIDVGAFAITRREWRSTRRLTIRLRRLLLLLDGRTHRWGQRCSPKARHARPSSSSSIHVWRLLLRRRRRRWWRRKRRSCAHSHPRHGHRTAAPTARHCGRRDRTSASQTGHGHAHAGRRRRQRRTRTTTTP